MKKILIISLLFYCCSAKVTPIEYGKDACNYCKMNIVERKFGAEVVTKKGKIFKYDATECMVNALKEMEEDKLAFIMTVDYDNPTVLITANESYFLKSEKIPSPMGAFLSAYKTKEAAEKSQGTNGGEIMDFETLKNKF